jgi:hypothetical protein
MGRVWYQGKPVRLTKVMLGEERETSTDLCGFYVFFDVDPAEHRVTVYDPKEKIRDTEMLSVSSGVVVEHDFHLSPSGMVIK